MRHRSGLRQGYPLRPISTLGPVAILFALQMGERRQIESHQKHEQCDRGVRARACVKENGGDGNEDSSVGAHQVHRFAECVRSGSAIVADAKDETRRGDARKCRHAVRRRGEGDGEVEEQR